MKSAKELQGLDVCPPVQQFISLKQTRLFIRVSLVPENLYDRTLSLRYNRTISRDNRHHDKRYIAGYQIKQIIFIV